LIYFNEGSVRYIYISVDERRKEEECWKETKSDTEAIYIDVNE
jgi:hypothetical protein